MIIGVDAGSQNCKSATEWGTDIFCSAITEYRERNVIDLHGKDDMVWVYEVDGEIERGFAGTLAKKENQYGSNMLGGSKNHFDAQMRILLAIHRQLPDNERDVYLACGNPIVSLTKEEKEEITAMLKRKTPHKVTVNGVTKEFYIREVVLTAEGCIGFWSQPTAERVNIIDVGGGTVNVTTIEDKRVIDKNSDTLPYGMCTAKGGKTDLNALAKGIQRDTSRIFSKHDKTLLLGGASEQLLPYIQSVYPNTSMIKPYYNTLKGMLEAKPIMANAIGMYVIAKHMFKEYA